MSAPIHSSEHRSRLLRGLQQPDCYPHAVGKIEHIETHISDVLLTGSYAYKLKKPLDLKFLDFSTLEKRRHYCEEELRLNRRTAPELYLAVVAITGDADRPRVAADGPALEYALQMRQFDQHGLLERVLARGELTDAHVDALADLVANFHSDLPPATAHSEFGTAQAIIAPALQNFEQLRPLLDEDEDRERLDSLHRWTAAQHATLTETFEQRRRDGFVRECHGDLHLGNIALIDGRVCIFDCIEFNPALRWIDVMSEVAFVAMDLIHRGHAHFAYRFLDRYLQSTGDYEGVPLLRYYMVYRALVRAKVAAMRGRQQTTSRDAVPSLSQRVRSHIELAATLARAAPPILIVMHGLSGSGKTRVSQTLLERIGGLRIRSDVERKRLHGWSANAHTESALGEGVYDAASSLATYECLRQLARPVLLGGFNAIIDAAFLRREQRDRLRGLAREMGVAFAIAHTHASESVLRERIARRAQNESDASEATVEVLDHQLQTQEPLGVDEQAETCIFDSEHDDDRAIVEKATQLLTI